MPVAMTAIILTGGKNVRMGSNKAFLKIGEERLIDRTIGILRDVFTEIILVTNTPLEYLDLGVAVVTDVIKGKSALGGIYTGLLHASCEYVFVTACDMPFIRRDFIMHMVRQADGSADVIVPRVPEGFQPLHAIYSRRCLPRIKRLIDQDRLKITGFYEQSRMTVIPGHVIDSFEGGPRMFFNVNTPEDLSAIPLPD
ncbi:MAG: molybdenum cofactor guanylyltransferase [Deltaproteobacteria bacterium]|nr:molybdenum cofactor guanylyltransferase [Deltaproteobacteria bacterium]